jgi:F0F1-type ATP synthase assembly protein I
MKEIEKYVVWASIITIFTYLLSLAGIFSIGAWGVKFVGVGTSALSYYLPNFVFALWLSYAASKQSLRKTTWALFGFASGIYAVAIFYILLSYFNILSIRKSLVK